MSAPARERLVDSDAPTQPMLDRLTAQTGEHLVLPRFGEIEDVIPTLTTAPFHDSIELQDEPSEEETAWLAKLAKRRRRKRKREKKPKLAAWFPKSC
jgi:hypothetical protein